MSEQTANLCTTDACESLRARLAKYEDAEGRPLRAKVRMPCRMYDAPDAESPEFARGHNTALDYVARLNSSPVSLNQCDSCEPAGVFATDGSGPFDCPDCGKKAAAQTTVKTVESYAALGVEGAAQVSAGVVDDRAAFEVAVCERYGYTPQTVSSRWNGSGYDDSSLCMAWVVWQQARTALTASAPNDQYRDLVWMAHQLADMVLKGDEPHTAVRVAKSLMRECEGKASAPSHGEQVRQMVLEELLTRCAEWCDKQPKQPWYGRTAGDMVRTFMACQPLAAAPSACSCGEPDAAGTHRKDGPCYWEPSAPSAGSQGGDE